MVIFFAGLIGTGKTTLAKAVAQKLGLCYYDVDAVKKEVYPTDPNFEYNLKNNIPFSDETRTKAFERVVQDFAVLAKKYTHIIVDETLHKKSLRTILLTGAEQYFGGYKIVWIKASEPIIEQRFKNQARDGHLLKDPFGMYLSFKKEFEDFDNADIIFFNDGQLENTIDELSTKITNLLS